mmetsp:Transcript_59865/g.129761  ORF Transcript_59865/g.129761 Transcript_59865/m.129761 type:complete len:308 (-) Transcript_59865:1905-2828(-)
MICPGLALLAAKVEHAEEGALHIECVKVTGPAERDGALVVVVAEQNPHAPNLVVRRPDDDVAVLRLQLSDLDDYRVALRLQTHRPNSPGCAKNHAERVEPSLQPLLASVVPLEERGRVVDQKGRTPTHGVSLEGLPDTAGARKLRDEARLVRIRQCSEGLHHCHRVLGLRHEDQAHHGNCRSVTWNLLVGQQCPPPSTQVLLHQPCLAQVGETAQERHGPEEGSKHILVELEHQLLRAAKRGRLCPCQIRDPMQEVEVNVRLVRARLHHSLELREHPPRRGLSLHEPAVVELHLALCEEDPLLLLRL